jgi:hypothetical protein
MIRTSHPSILSLFVLAVACGGSTAAGGSADVCEQDGKTYEIGETFARECHTCQCTRAGIDCTDQPCVTPCTYQGKQYAPGQSFPAGDGCNNCFCSGDGSVGCTLMDCSSALCFYAGQTYSPGQTFPATDGCNHCACQSDGSVVCTEKDCAAICVYGGKTYTPEDGVFPSLDGCNTCQCTNEGFVSCTELACSCNPAAEWWREYVATSPQDCMVIDYACPENTIAFSNACGCGCEQSQQCPQFFDCMPPASCNEAELKKKCPYSGFAY